MNLQPLPQALITAAKLEKQAEELVLMAKELRASVGPINQEATGVFIFGPVAKRKRSCGKKLQ